MNKNSILAAAAIAALAAGAVSAADSEVEVLKKRIEKLEEAQEKQSDQTAQVATKVKAAEWASKLSWKGDFRYRHENIDAEGTATEQLRHRIRARFGLTAKVNDTVNVTVQLATNGGNNDPRSTNQTLGSGWDRKGVAIDLAYADWKAMDGVNVQLGKMPMPWQRVASYAWDGDISPEGAAVKYARGAFFANAFGMWLQEASGGSDANLVGAQLGFKVGSDVKFTGAVGYFDVGAVQNEIVSTIGASTCSSNNAFFNTSTNGNVTFDDNGAVANGCNRLLNDFNIVEVLAQVDMKLGSLPFTAFGEYIQNQDANAEDAGYAVGFMFGKVADPKTWELGFIYQDMDKDAQFGQFVDSDFGSGTTGSKGSVFKAGYGIAKNWAFNATYFMNQRRTGNSLTAPWLDYDRYQLDLNFKF